MDSVIWFGKFLDGMLLGYVTSRMATLSAWLGPIATAAVTIWGVFLSRAIGAGEVANPAGTFSWQAFQKAMVVGFATIVGVYQGIVIDGIESMAGPMITFFAPPNSPLPASADVWTAMAQLNNQSGELLSKLNSEQIPNLELIAGAISVVFVSIGSGVLLLIAIGVTVLAKVFRFFVLLIGPIFILFLLAKQTTGLFFSWLHMLLSMVVLTWVVYFTLGLSLYAGNEFVNNTIAGMSAANIVKMTFGYMIGCIALGILIWNSPGVASGITGGTPMQLGSQLLSQAAMTYLMSRNPAPPPPAANSPNTVGNASVPYAAGHAMGSAASGAARWAYQQIASRSRSSGGSNQS